MDEELSAEDVVVPEFGNRAEGAGANFMICVCEHRHKRAEVPMLGVEENDQRWHLDPRKEVKSQVKAGAGSPTA